MLNIVSLPRRVRSGRSGRLPRGLLRARRRRRRHVPRRHPRRLALALGPGAGAGARMPVRRTAATAHAVRDREAVVPDRAPRRRRQPRLGAAAHTNA